MEPGTATSYNGASPIIGYRVFNSTDEFESWQRDEVREIYSIMPMVLSLGGDVTNEKFNAASNVGCFVTYRL